jgi:outer membrane protein OmpA-like peptidoglycan-associated protein
MKKLVPALIIMSVIISACSQEKKLSRKASNSVERSEFEEALGYYDQILEKDSNSYYANAGKGVVLSEYIGRHDQAIPYLEKALKQHPEKTGMKINYDLGKSYHFIGNFPRALYFYGATEKYNQVDNPNYDIFLSKRIADCKYALDHPEVAPPEQQAIANLGSAINTPMPEYGGVYVNDKLIFTSKRRDDDKEKKNGIDGRFFDAMYVSNVNGNEYTAPRRFTVPDTKGNANFSQPHESVVSVSPDGKTLYIFREGQIYEADMNNLTKSPRKLGNDVNISYLQSHAAISADGNMIVFSSEAKRGNGGLDLYKTVKDENGKWSQVELLDNSINTSFNEDAPYLATDGTLFFASNGLPGYGGYDIYKTSMVDGRWTTPENVGQPINSPGDDTYFALKPNNSNGYYTSVRKDGEGDMDIYKVHYVSGKVPDCTTINPMFAINATKDATNDKAYVMSVQVPAGYQSNIRSYQWKINGNVVAQTSAQLPYTFETAGTYTVSSKAVVYCDTCPSLLAMCCEKILEVGTPVFAATEPAVAAPLADSKTKTKKTKSKSAPIDHQTKDIKDYSSTKAVTMSESQLKDMGWNTGAAYFDLNKSDLREESKAMLNQNIEILKKNKNLAVNINGYADSRGSEAYNMGLSQRRANAIKAYMLQNGISSLRIQKTTGFGESNLVNNCSDGVECSEAEHQLNRRTEFEVINLVKTTVDFTIN